MKLMLSAKDFIPALKVIASHASKDFTRPHLNGVHFRWNGAALELVATDSHRLALYRLPPSEVHGADTAKADEHTTVRLVEIATFLKAAGKPGIGGVILDTDAGELSLWSARVTFDAKDAREVNFPPYAQILPEKVGGPLPLVSGTYLAQAAESFATLTPKGAVGGISIQASPDFGPIAITSEAVPGLLIIIMPMRGDVNPNAPAILSTMPARLPGNTAKVEPPAKKKSKAA